MGLMLAQRGVQTGEEMVTSRRNNREGCWAIFSSSFTGCDILFGFRGEPDVPGCPCWNAATLGLLRHRGLHQHLSRPALQICLFIIVPELRCFYPEWFSAQPKFKFLELLSPHSKVPVAVLEGSSTLHPGDLWSIPATSSSSEQVE